MDISTIFSIFIQLWWLLPIIAVIMFFKSPIGKGIAGEGLLNALLYLLLDKRKYQLLKNITLPTEGGTTQIDHIIVSRYGVFVIETKNMKGWIFGLEHQSTWTQNIYKKKFSFQNPLHQNYKHVKVLQKLLDLTNDEIFSVVVFLGGATFKTDVPKNVLYPLGLIEHIKEQKKIIFTQREMWRVIEEIEDNKFDNSFKTHREHVKNLNVNRNKMTHSEFMKNQNAYRNKRVVEAKEPKQNNLICAKCGSDMVLRTAKKGKNIGGQFYGCSTFPKCWHKQNIKR